MVLPLAAVTTTTTTIAAVVFSGVLVRAAQELASRRAWTPTSSRAFTQGETMSKRKAVTVDELGGSAHSRVDFIRTDARAVKRATPSNTHLKGALSSPFELPSGLTGLAAAGVIRQRVSSCTGGQTGQVPSGVVIGLGAVTRRLRRGELQAVIVAREMHPPLLVAHLPVLAAKSGVPLCLLGCSSAQLGQPFGLLRVAAIGFAVDHFGLDHPLIQLLAESMTATPKWLAAALKSDRNEENVVDPCAPCIQDTSSSAVASSPGDSGRTECDPQ